MEEANSIIWGLSGSLMRLRALWGCMKWRTSASQCHTSSCCPTSSGAVEQRGNWWSIRASPCSQWTRWPNLCWLEWGGEVMICVGEICPMGCFCTKRFIHKFHKISRFPVVPDHHKGITSVKEIIKTIEGSVFFFFWWVSQKKYVQETYDYWGKIHMIVRDQDKTLFKVK